MKKIKIVLFVILLITVGQCVDVYLPSMPAIANSFQTTYDIVQITITISMIFFGLALIAYGPISDFLGRKRTALIGLSIFIIGAILCIFSANISQLLVARAIQGLGIGSVGAVAPAILCDTYSGNELVKASSCVSVAYAITPLLAPVIGGYLEHYFNWRASFIFLFGYAFIVYLLFMIFFTETSSMRLRKKFTINGVINSYISVILNIRFLSFLICFMLFFSGEMLYAVNSPYLYQVKLGLSPITNGWLFVFTVISFFIGSFLSYLMSPYFDSVKILFFSSVLAILSMLMMLCFSLFFSLSLFTILLPIMIYMLCAGLVYPNAITGCMSSVTENLGVASAVMSAAQMTGAGVIVSVVAKFKLHSQLLLSTTLLIMALIAFFVIFFVLMCYQHRNESVCLQSS